jgi:hypothetical protein
MKKLLVLLLSIGLLTACSDAKETSSKDLSSNTSSTDVEDVSNEPTQEELDAKLKEEAQQANFKALNEDYSAGQKVTATGKVSFVYEDGVGGSFSLETNEDGGYGMYNIKNFALSEIQEGQEVTIYGTTTGNTANDGSVEINATIIE